MNLIFPSERWWKIFVYLTLQQGVQISAGNLDFKLLGDTPISSSGGDVHVRFTGVKDLMDPTKGWPPMTPATLMGFMTESAPKGKNTREFSPGIRENAIPVFS